MSLNKKIIAALYLVLFVGVLSASFFLIRASVVDKQNYLYDLQLSNGLMITNSLKEKSNLNNEKFEDLLSSSVDNLNDSNNMGIGLLYKKGNKTTIFKKADGQFWPSSIELPNNYWVNKVATSALRNGLIISVLPFDNQRSLIVVSKDDHVFNMVLSYLEKTLPYLLLIILLIGICGWYFASRLTKPIENLNTSTKELAKGQWEVKVPNTTTTEINQLVESFNHLGGQLYEREQEVLAKERLSALGTFSAGMAHELKNPLNVISSYSQLLQRKLSNGTKEKKHVDIIHSEVLRATRIINDLMNFSRQKSLCLKPILVADFVGKLTKNFNSIEKNNKFNFSTNVTDCSEIKVDEDLFFQVVINIIENATHVLEEHKVGDPTIKLDISKSESSVNISIKDNGPGIPDKIIKNIFEPFYTTKTVGKGTGLGLAFCKGIINQHHGELVVNSKPGETEFLITVPS